MKGMIYEGCINRFVYQQYCFLNDLKEIFKKYYFCYFWGKICCFL